MCKKILHSTFRKNKRIGLVGKPGRFGVQVDSVNTCFFVRELKRSEIYVYIWKNNPKRETMRGRQCKILVSGKMNSVLIEFIDNGQKEIVSRNSLRKNSG